MFRLHKAPRPKPPRWISSWKNQINVLDGSAALANAGLQILAQKCLLVAPDVNPVFGLRELVILAGIGVSEECFAGLLERLDELLRFIRGQLRIGQSILNEKGRLDLRDVGNDVRLPIGFGLFFRGSAHFDLPAYLGISIGPLKKSGSIDSAAIRDARDPKVRKLGDRVMHHGRAVVGATDGNRRGVGETLIDKILYRRAHILYFCSP